MKWAANDPYTSEEIWHLHWLVKEGHSPVSASIVLGRGPSSLTKRAAKSGFPFGLLSEDHRSFQVSVDPETYKALVSIGQELSLGPSRLTRIILMAAHRRNLWASILDLQRPMP